MAEKKTARQALTEVLEEIRPTEKWIAVHELTMIPNHSQNSLASELPAMAKDGLAESRRRAGTRYKEWRPSASVAVKPCAPFSDEMEAA